MPKDDLPGNPDETPFIFRPNMKDDDPRNGLICFKDMSRECGASCMAFETYPPPGADYQGKQWSHCMLLVAEHRKGKHLVIIADQVSRIIKSQENAKADAIRTAAIQTVPAPNAGVR